MDDYWSLLVFTGLYWSLLVFIGLYERLRTTKESQAELVVILQHCLGCERDD